MNRLQRGSTDAENTFEKIQHSFMITIPSKPKTEGNFVSPLKHIWGKKKKPTAVKVLNGERLDALPLRSGARQGCMFSPLLFNITLKVLDNLLKQ